jgi:murein DD-endopeptidase MepM/ murein hydrolase activator NlpD
VVDVDPGADLSPEIVGAFSPIRAELKHMRSRGFVPTGLSPVYPKDANCPQVSSPFASETRGDGSRRATQFFHGYHGGMDIPVPEGTPILAIADGTVVHKADGPNIGGIGLILQHAPEDTGLPIWIYTEYKHLKEMPALAVGQRVRMGDTIALAGKTGTVGGYYGEAGHSHLHLTAFYSDNSDYRAQRLFVPIDGHWMDPLALYKRPPHNSHALRNLPDDAKKVRIPYVATTGKRVPEETKVIWPFACAPR